MPNSRIDNFMVFDYETGGFDSKKNPAIEIAAIWLDGENFEEIDRYEALILDYDPNLVIKAEALKANGISLEEVAENGVELADVIQTIIEKTKKCNEGKMRGKKTILVGQDVCFDISFLHQNFDHLKQDMSKIFAGRKDYYGNFQPTYIDTLHLGRTRWGHDHDKTAFGLQNLCFYDQIDLTNAHRAMADVESTKELFIKLMMKLRSETGSDNSSFNFRENFKFQI